MNKRKPLQPGDIVTLKPIALLIAEKQIKYKGKTQWEGRLYAGGPGIIEGMIWIWNDKKIVHIVEETGFVSKDGIYRYSNSWIKSVKRCKKDQ